jgi:hypothetical protein
VNPPLLLQSLVLTNSRGREIIVTISSKPPPELIVQIGMG